MFKIPPSGRKPDKSRRHRQILFPDIRFRKWRRGWRNCSHNQNRPLLKFALARSKLIHITNPNTPISRLGIVLAVFPAALYVQRNLVGTRQTHTPYAHLPRSERQALRGSKQQSKTAISDVFLSRPHHPFRSLYSRFSPRCRR